MLKTTLLHPEILRALASSGHGSRVLIADGNFAYSTNAWAGAARVFLNLRSGMVRVTDVLETLAQAVPMESVTLMLPPDGKPQPIHGEIQALLPPGTPVEWRMRTEYIEETRKPDLALLIATGEERRFANVLITVGVVMPKA